MDIFHKTANCFKLLITLCAATIVINIPLLCSCKYKALATIDEQIAIYQNKGFIKITNPAPTINLQNCQLFINDKNSINNYLIATNIGCEISHIFMLYLQNNADFIDGLIYIYQFNDTKSAKTFYNHFYLLQKSNICLINNYVIQKGINYYINNGAINYKYFIDFCAGIANKK